MNDQTTYPVGHQFSIGYNPVEDRLKLTTELKEAGPTTLLLTRRMVSLVLKQILDRLPNLSGLDQTPANYWQDVLQITHQQALERHRQETAEARSRPAKTGKVPANTTETPEPNDTRPAGSSDRSVFLATELTCQQDNDRLHLAFNGLARPDSIEGAAQHVPVLALSLEAIHAHQVLQLLMSHAARANWHLPVDLPWTQGKTGHQSAQTPSH